MVNNKNFELRPMDDLVAIVKQDFRKFEEEGLIDEGSLIKEIMRCNDKLGINIREVKQLCIPVEDYKAKLPIDFEKLYYAVAIKATNSIVHKLTNPFNNSFDRDIIYEAEVDKDSFGGTDHYNITIKREQHVTVHSFGELVPLDVSAVSHPHCHVSCPNTRKKGKYTVSIMNDHLETPFRSGEIYIMYLATMTDEDGNLLFPFHPLITPYYEWSLKEKVVMDAIFNSDLADANLLALAQRERVKAWLDAFAMTTEKGFGEFAEMQRTKELKWYNQYFKTFQ